MNDNTFVFAEIDSSESFTGLAAAFNTRPVNNSILIPSEKGTGFIRKIDFEKGLHIRAWDIKLSHRFELSRKKTVDHEDGKSFSIVYLLSPDTVVVENPAVHKEMLLQGSLNILLLSNCNDLNFHIIPGQPLKAIDITVCAEWMNSQVDLSDPVIINFLTKLNNNRNPFFFIDKGNAAEYKAAMDIHSGIQSGNKALLYLKAKTLSLISDFFTKPAFHTANPIADNNTTLHQEKMLMVEKILEDHFEKDLPSIEKIAQQAAMSESTLKRHFKMMFGKSIYEYYLEKKMDYAKRLLLEKPLTVKEVAYRLGYEKTSNFIHIFKKFHTYSPGYLKKTFSI